MISNQHKTNMRYEIGQMIYILSDKSNTVVPAIISSRQTNENIGLDGQIGEIISYKVKVGPPNKVQILDLEKIDGSVFVSLDDIKQNLTIQLTNFITKLLESTEEKANAWYGVQRQTLTDSPNNMSIKLDPEQVISAIEKEIPLQPVDKNSDNEVIGEIMPDGTIRPATRG